MQGQLLEQLRHQHRQRRGRIVRQIADQAAGGHVGAGLVQDVAGALDLDIGAGDLDVGHGPARAAAGIEPRRPRRPRPRSRPAARLAGSGTEKKLAANAVVRPAGDRIDRADLVAAERRAGDGGHGAEQGASAAGASSASGSMSCSVADSRVTS